ncbi:helix-turn-helix transcriptional regulator [Bacillus sp. BGMRC 2118]|nr:helix-turn-helix transcriptional regulator [Bacillus sp. BGMRC 2118]
MGIGNHIKFHRQSKGITQRQLADGICSTSYLSKIESESVEPAQEMIELLCEKIGISKELWILQTDEVPTLQREYEGFYRILQQDIVLAKSKMDSISENFLVTEPESHLMKEIFALLYHVYNRDKEAAHICYESLDRLKEYQSAWTRQYYFRAVGLYYYINQHYDRSIEAYKKAEKYTPNHDLGEVYYHLALAYSQIENVGTSIYYLKKALDIFLVKMDYDKVTNCNLLLGINHRKLKEYTQAKENYTSILNHLAGKKAERLKAKIYHNLGLVFSEEGDSIQAIEYYLKSLEFRKDPATQLITVYVLASEYEKTHQLEKALEYFEIGEKYAQSLEDDEYQIMFKVLAFKLRRQIDTVEFEEYMLQVAIPFFEKRKEYYTFSHYINLLTSYYENSRQYKNAYLLLRKLLPEQRGMLV